MIGPYGGQVVQVVSILMSPFIMVYGLYVIAHGHYGPGGGFAGGVVLGVGVILLRVTVESEAVYRRFPPTLGLTAGVLGMLAFVLVGLVPLLAGGSFLDYAAVAAGVEDARLRYLGILVVEVAVGLAVFGAMLAIFDLLAGDRR